MPIAVACACGAKLKAPDTAAGKRVKCPKCGDPVAVPAAAEYEVVEDDLPPTPARKKPQLVDEDDESPRQAKAKGKGKPVEVDEPVDDEEDEDEDEKPKKKAGKRRKGKNREEEKKKRMLTLILGICGAVVVLGAAGAVIAFAVNMKDPSKVTGPRQPTPPPLPAGWSTFKGDGFSVGRPADVTLELQPAPPKPPGATAAETKSYTGMIVPTQPDQSPLVYVVGVTTIPPEEMAKIGNDKDKLWAEVQARAKTAGATLSNEKPIRVGGLEGRQFNFKQAFLTGVVRVVLTDSKVYQWGVLDEKGVNEDDAKVKPFLESFKIE